MSSPFIGMIIQVGFTCPPRGWAFCNGQLISIAQNTALFSLIGTTYGGNGQTTFALPNLQGRVPIHPGQGAGLSPYVLGQTGGEENHTLITTEMPAHTHTATFNGSTSTLSASTTKATLQTAVAGAVLGKSTDSAGTAVPLIYSPAGTATPVALGGLNVAGTVTNANTGGSQPHNNLQPYLAINFCIALQGIFPSRS